MCLWKSGGSFRLMAMASLKPEPTAACCLSPEPCGHPRTGHASSYTHLKKSLLQADAGREMLRFRPALLRASS